MNYQTDSSKYSYDKHSRQFNETDFLKQVRRTINGEPISQEQIKLIIDSILYNLKLNKNDTILDLACGNGSLSKDIFPHCKGYLGVDISENLVLVAKKYFEKPPNYQFDMLDALECIKTLEHPEKYTKIMCYASAQYFPNDMLKEILKITIARFKNVKIFLLGNIPDKDKANEFYKERNSDEEVLDSNETPIGIWRTQSTIADIALNTGWNCRCQKMPEEFYASCYRYDSILTRE